MNRLLSIALIALLASAAGCGSEEGPPDDGLKCSQETRDDEYVPGMSKLGAGGAFEFVLIESQPAPPDKNDNVWIVDVLDADSGAAVDGADVAATPFMPDHGHGTPIEAVVSPAGETGRYRIEQINLWMPGLWEVTLEATTADASDEAVYAFCIEG